MHDDRPADVGTKEFESSLAPILDKAYALALSLARNPADAEDLVQDAALAAFRAFDSFEPGTNFKAWFYKILVNRFFASRRGAGRLSTAVDLEDVPALYMYARAAETGLLSVADDPARRVMGKLGQEHVLEAIRRLPEEYRAVATLHFVDEMKYEEVSTVLGCPVGTVRSRLHRSRKMLQKSLWTLACEAGIVGELTRRGAEA